MKIFRLPLLLFATAISLAGCNAFREPVYRKPDAPLLGAPTDAERERREHQESDRFPR